MSIHMCTHVSQPMLTRIDMRMSVYVSIHMSMYMSRPISIPVSLYGRYVSIRHMPMHMSVYKHMHMSTHMSLHNLTARAFFHMCMLICIHISICVSEKKICARVYMYSIHMSIHMVSPTSMPMSTHTCHTHVYTHMCV